MLVGDNQVSMIIQTGATWNAVMHLTIKKSRLCSKKVVIATNKHLVELISKKSTLMSKA